MPGIGTGGGLKLYVQDRAGRGLPALEQATWLVAGTAARNPRFNQAFTQFNTHTPQVYADIDRTKAELLQVPIDRVFSTLSVYMGSSYINDFNLLGRTYQVSAQADNPFRLKRTPRREPEDAQQLRGHGADRVGCHVPRHHRAVPGATLQSLSGGRGALGLVRGFSTGQAITDMERSRASACRQGTSYEWTGTLAAGDAAGGVATFLFGLALIVVFLCWRRCTRAGSCRSPSCWSCRSWCSARCSRDAARAGERPGGRSAW